MRFLRANNCPSIDIFKDSDFTEFRATLDAEMKRLQALGVGSKKRQAEPLTEEEEEVLWQKGLLGDHTPQALLDTMVFMNGLYFALRSGNEHRNLRFSPCQIEVHDNEGERPYLLYTEDLSKNHPGGLKGRRIKPKVVRHYANIENPSRCFVTLFKRYTTLCPPKTSKNAFYLQPLRNPTPHCWYSQEPLGHNKLAGTVSRLCKSAGIKGFKTNHSLRVTNATRLYSSGTDEQLIMERTGHRSTDGVRPYKRTSEEQQIAISDILNRSKKPRSEQQQLVPSTQDSAQLSSEHPALFPHSGLTTQSSAFTKTQCNTIPGTFQFNHCGSVTINLNYNN